MNNYYLVARNRRTNDFKIIGLREKWYLGKKGTDEFHEANSLAAIDFVTSCFSDREHLAERLWRNGYIDDPNVDLFIANRTSRKGKPTIRFDEVIYTPKMNKRMKSAREVAMASILGRTSAAAEAMDIVYDDLILIAYSNAEFYSMLVDGELSVGKVFAQKLNNVHSYDDVPFHIKKDNDFGYDSYLIFRNIVETLNRVDSFYKMTREDIYEVNADFIDANASDRGDLIPELLAAINQDRCYQQLSLFDYIDLPREKAKEEKQSSIRPVEIDSKSTLTIAEKRSAVFRFLKGLSVDAFKRGQEGYVVNYDVFKHPLLDDEKKRLDTLLTGNMPKFFASYALNSKRIRDAGTYFSTPSEVNELRWLLNRDCDSINKRFLSEKCVNKTYEWCMLYKACKKRDAEYEASGFTVNPGDEYGKIFAKKD